MNKSNNNLENSNQPDNNQNLGNNNYPNSSNNPYVNGNNPYNLGYPNNDLPFLDNDLENNQSLNQNFGVPSGNDQLFPEMDNNSMINDLSNNNDMLPGFENTNNDDMLPGLENTNNNDMLPGFENTNNDDMLPGLGTNNGNGMLPPLDDNYDDDRMISDFNSNNYFNPESNDNYNSNYNTENNYQQQQDSNMFDQGNNPFNYNQNNVQYEQPNDYQNMDYSDNSYQSDNYANTDYSNNNNLNNNYSNDNYNEQFVKNWMGTLYEKAHSKKFNWCAALFGPAYLLFRKMYLTGALAAVLMLIVSIMTTLLTAKVPALGFVLCIAIIAAYILGFGFSFYPLYRSFVSKKLSTLKNATADNNQLLSIATQKGGTSVLAVILYFIGYSILTTVLMGILISAIGLTIFNSARTAISDMDNTLNSDEISNRSQVQNSLFNFYEDYSISYNASNWFLDETNKSLTFGNYVLAYKAQYPSTTFNSDMSTSDGRASVLNLLSTSLQKQAASVNMQVEVGNSSFATQNSIYYAYIDIIDTSSISRYYFVIVPDEQLLFQFVLTVNDTIIDDSTNVVVLDMLSSLSKKQSTENVSTSNEVSENARQVLSYDTNTRNTSNVTNEDNSSNQLATNATNNTSTIRNTNYTVSNSNLTDMINNQ